jgi:hypothetical protein
LEPVSTLRVDQGNSLRFYLPATMSLRVSRSILRSSWHLAVLVTFIGIPRLSPCDFTPGRFHRRPESFIDLNSSERSIILHRLERQSRPEATVSNGSSRYFAPARRLRYEIRFGESTVNFVGGQRETRFVYAVSESTRFWLDTPWNVSFGFSRRRRSKRIAWRSSLIVFPPLLAGSR